VELAVIDAGNGRLAEAVTLLDEAVGLFDGLMDRRGRDWAVFLRATVQPLLSGDGLSLARAGLESLRGDACPGRDPDLEEYAEAFAVLLERGTVTPGAPWDAWRLGMTPGRGTRMIMAVPV
jgi:hypothetical protein